MSVTSSFTSMVVHFGNLKAEVPYVHRTNKAYIPAINPDYVLLEYMYDIYMGIEDGHVYIGGETGLGKTDGVIQLAAYLNHPVREINMRGDINPEHFIGYMLAKEGSTYFEPGILLDCMENGYWLIVDEWDYGNPMIMSSLNSVMQSGYLYVPELGKRVYAAEGFKVFATANTFGAGDETGFYPGTRIQNSAVMDRFDTFVEATFPDNRALKIIIDRKYGELKNVDKILQYVYEMRKAVESHQINSPFGVRSTLQFTKKMRKNIYGPWKSAQLSFAQSLDENSQAICRGIIQRVFGGESDV